MHTRSTRKKTKRDEIREAAENDLTKFIQLVAPYRVLGDVHKEVIQWWQRQDAKNHQLLLLPRDHGKSALVAYRVAQAIAKNPLVRIIYMSSTSLLAEKQLSFIKNILTSETFQYYWPDYIAEKESERTKWTNTEISLDHEERQRENIRDATIFTAGLTTSLTGLHCDIAVFDDIVVMENAYTEQGRTKVAGQYSLLNSIVGGEGVQWVVGTRYDPNDLYGTMLAMEKDLYNEDGGITGKENIFEVFERPVENLGDGTGQFLWPRQQRYDGKWFGFDRDILAEKRGLYVDQRQFRAQYYNNPNWSSDDAISRDYFQYYDPKFLQRYEGKWSYKGKTLNVVAAIDFAYSVSRRSDYTAIVVIGIDHARNTYVLDMMRFKTTKISDYYRGILDLYNKWGFRKIRAEANVAQQAIVDELRNEYIKRNGLALSVDVHKPSRYAGTKEERMYNTLAPRYENMSIWHYRGGLTQILEEELTSSRPPHDDLMDALTSAMDIAQPPMDQDRLNRTRQNNSRPQYHSRFGGVSL